HPAMERMEFYVPFIRHKPMVFQLRWSSYAIGIKKSDWLAILSTDCTLSDQEIIRIYGMRWDIEVFFKTTKSLLKLEKEFQSRSYDALISHTTIVFTRYIVLSWQNRCRPYIRWHVL